jgi:surface antigen
VLHSSAADGDSVKKARGLYEGLSATDLQRAEDNLQLALEKHLSQNAVSWQSPDGTVTGFAMPVRSFKIDTGHYCREFFETVAFGEVWRSAGGTACRSEQGRWLVVAP